MTNVVSVMVLEMTLENSVTVKVTPLMLVDNVVEMVFQLVTVIVKEEKQMIVVSVEE